MIIRRRVGLRIITCLLGISIIALGGIFIASWTISIASIEKEPGFCASENSLAPELTLRGGKVVTTLLNEPYEELGVEVIDDCEEIVAEISGVVETDKVGDYEIWYRATDRTGNLAEISRIVKVRESLNGTIYLTFDDGPSPYTAELLDILDQYKVKATFFVTGAGDDELILRAFQDGHAIGIHTNSHQYSYIYQNTGNFWADFDIVSGRVERITGESTKLMRFPGGSSNTVSRLYDGRSRVMSQLVNEAEAKGLIYFDWNVDSEDSGAAKTSEEVFLNVASRLKSGDDSVILQHDTKDYSIRAVPMIIEYGFENGYAFDKLNYQSPTVRHRVNN